MRFKWTILNVCAIIYLISCIGFTLQNFSDISSNEGWGMAYMLVLIVLGLSALLADLIIRKFVKPGKAQQIVSAITTILYIIVIYSGT